MSDARKKVVVTLNHVLPEEERDLWKRVEDQDSYRPMRKGEEGDPAVYSALLTDAEIDAMMDASNLKRIEEVKGAQVTPNVDSNVPNDVDLRSHKADMLPGWGFTGAGIDVGVIDTGLGSGVASKFNIKAIRGEEGLTPYANSHGSYTSSLAVPTASRLVFSRAIDETAGGSYDSTNWVAALYWMVDQIGVDVVNMSFSGDQFEQFGQDVIHHARQNGVLPVCSAGNEGVASQRYPAAYEGAIAVGALDRFKSWSRWPGSNYGSWVDLWANGVNVLTYGPAGGETTQTGTSVAAPLVVWLKASLLTKGKDSLGDVGIENAVRNGSGPTIGTGGGGQIDGEQSAYRMADEC